MWPAVVPAREKAQEDGPVPDFAALQKIFAARALTPPAVESNLARVLMSCSWPSAGN